MHGTVEQVVRDILTAVQKDDYLMMLLATGIDPQSYSASDLLAPANVLNASIGPNGVRVES